MIFYFDGKTEDNLLLIYNNAKDLWEELVSLTKENTNIIKIETDKLYSEELTSEDMDRFFEYLNMMKIKFSKKEDSHERI